MQISAGAWALWANVGSKETCSKKPPTTLPVPHRTSSSFHSRSRPKWPRHALRLCPTRVRRAYSSQASAVELRLSHTRRLCLRGQSACPKHYSTSSSYATFNLRVTEEEQGSRRRETAYPLLSILQQLHARCPNTELAPPVSHLVEVVEDG
jgi:hypothetical protein